MVMAIDCISCDDREATETLPSLVIDSSFGYCDECRANYAEPKNLIRDAINGLYKSIDDAPDWFFDLTYYEDGEYKSVQNIL